MKLLALMLKNLSRNKIRTALTTLAIFTLVAIFSMIYSVIRFLDQSVATKSRDIKLVLTEKYRIPSRFDIAKMKSITERGELHAKLMEIEGFRPEQYATWTFVAATLDPNMKDRDQFFFCIATQPDRIPVMVDALEGFDPTVVQKMAYPPICRLLNQGILMGPDRMKKLNKKVGDRLKAKTVNFRSDKNEVIEIEPEIVGELPGDTRWADGAFMDVEYLNRILEEKKAPLANKVNLGWLMVDTKEAADAVLSVLSRDAILKEELKVEEASTAVGRFLEPLKDLLWGVKFLLLPAIVIVMTVIIANAISITVRERVREIGVLKVLGFSRGKILTLILGEGLFLGALAGTLSGLVTVLLVNYGVGGLKIPLGFFPVFFVPWHALWWGAVLGILTAFIGGILPVWSGVSVKVSEIFAKVA